MNHAQKRLKQRYHINPTRAIIRRIRDMIRYKSKKAILIRPARGPAEIYQVPVGKKRVLVVFNWRMKGIVTFLPKEALNN